MAAAYSPETNSINSFVKRKLNTYNKLLTFPPAGQTMVAVGELRSNYKRMAHNGKFIC